MTTVLLDNTTFAAAGRAIYYGDRNVEGGKHAHEYYEKYSDAKWVDERSLAEFLTALILFDQLRWEGSSFYTQETKPMNESSGKGIKEAWVYKWFPIFSLANDARVIESHCTKVSGLRLTASKEIAVQWVLRALKQGDLKLPPHFKIPLAYFDPSHPEKPELENCIKDGKMRDDDVPLVLFVQRGLFYQGVAMASGDWSYIPHSYRNTLMAEAQQQFASLICSSITSINDVDVWKDLDSVFVKRVTEVVRIPAERLQGIAIGASFLHKSKTALDAIESAMSFRDTSEGREVRERFGALLGLNRKGELPRMRAELTDIDKALRNAILNKYGSAVDGSPNLKFFLGFLGPMQKAVEAAIELLPAEKRTRLMELLHTQLGRKTGFQILFENYFST